MEDNKGSKISQVDFSKMDASIKTLLNILSNKSSKSSQHKEQCNNNSHPKKRIVKKLNTDLIKQILMETKKRKKNKK